MALNPFEIELHLITGCPEPGESFCQAMGLEGDRHDELHKLLHSETTRLLTKPDDFFDAATLLKAFSAHCDNANELAWGSALIGRMAQEATPMGLFSAAALWAFRAEPVKYLGHVISQIINQKDKPDDDVIDEIELLLRRLKIFSDPPNG